jgi:HSP20 family protein
MQVNGPAARQEADPPYRVKAVLPGVDKKDIGVKIDGDVVSIGAKAERDKKHRFSDTQSLRKRG